MREESTATADNAGNDRDARVRFNKMKNKRKTKGLGKLNWWMINNNVDEGRKQSNN